MNKNAQVVRKALFGVVLAASAAVAQAASPQVESYVTRSALFNPGQLEQMVLHSSSVLVQDAASGATIFSKNSAAVVPIASITKLMTAMVVLDRGLDLNQRVVVSDLDMDTLKHTSSRLRPGATLSRDELLMLALMSSENRAAAALARTYPGGTSVFVAAMNAKAKALGMNDSRFHDSTGLSPTNVSSAPDLAKLVKAAHGYSVIRHHSTLGGAQVNVLGQSLKYNNTNGLVRNGGWDIGLQKTGFINEAGRCLVMRVRMASKDLVVVLLDSFGKNSRIADAQSIRKWMEAARVTRGNV